MKSYRPTQLKPFFTFNFFKTSVFDVEWLRLRACERDGFQLVIIIGRVSVMYWQKEICLSYGI